MSTSTPHPRRWLVVRLEAPLVAFGGVAIDRIGPTRDFPALSAITGLFANALGYDRTERQKHQDLQDRLIFAARRERESSLGILRDMQNVQDLHLEKRGWTTRGKPEERGGGSLDETHRRERDYHPDAALLVVMTLRDPEVSPSLDDLAAALDAPARPLFIGRKPCLPSSPLRPRSDDKQPVEVYAETAHAALCSATFSGCPEAKGQTCRAEWPAGEGPTHGQSVTRTAAVADVRNWLTGLHGGTRTLVEGHIVMVAAKAGGHSPESSP